MGLGTRAHDGHDTTALVHHSDQPSPGVQYLAIRYTERLAEAGAVASVGSKGDSYDTRWPGGTSRLRGRRSTPSSKPTQAPRRDWARPTRRIRDHPPQHHPPRATCSAGGRTLHQTRYLTHGASVLAQELGQVSRCPQTGPCATEGRMGHLTASARSVGPATPLGLISRTGSPVRLMSR